MALRRLCKASDSMGADNCPAVYVEDEPQWLIAQGKALDDVLTGQLLDLAADETAVRVPTETIVRAVAMLLAERGEPALAGDISRILSPVAEMEVSAP